MRKSLLASAVLAAVVESQCTPEWAPWSQWSDCTASCGQGSTRSRDRLCNPCDGEGSGGNGFGDIPDCDGINEELDRCELPDCPDWDDWYEVTGVCSASCNGGQMLMQRDCKAEGGEGSLVNSEECDGEGNAFKDCNEQSCTPTTAPVTTTTEFVVPVVPEEIIEESTDNDGYWTAWTNWSGCTRTCDGGTRFRERQAVITTVGAFLHNDENTEFEYKHGDFNVETEACNQDECGQCNQSQWTEYTSCVGKCGSEPAFRTRKCICTGTESREFCSGVNEYVPDHHELSLEDYETSKPTHWFEEIEGGQSETEFVYCEDLGINDCPAPPPVPLVEKATFHFTIAASQSFGVPSYYYINGDLEQPTNEVAWDTMVAGVRMWIGEQDYHPSDFGYKFEEIEYTPGHGTLVGVTLTLHIELHITAVADASTGLNPLRMTDLTARMTTLHNKLTGTSDDTDVEGFRRRKRQAGDPGFSFVPFGNAVLAVDTFFDAVDAGISSTPNTVTAVFPQNALYQLFETSINDASLAGAFLGTGCHCMRLGDYAPAIDRELGGYLALDNLDRICKRWFGQHRCVYAEGGNCFGQDHLQDQAYFVEFDITAGLLCDTINTWNPTMNAGELSCLADMCAIDNAFTLQALDHVSLTGGITVNPGVDPISFVSQCEHGAGSNVTKTCTGSAPNLRWAN